MGGKQLGLSDYEQSTAKRRTKLEKYLAEMDRVLRWQPLIDLIEPFYPKTGPKGGRLSFPLQTMLRIHLMQHWTSLSDPAMEVALIEVPSMRRFAGIDLISQRIPDVTTMKHGTIINATLIAAPSSTKNKRQSVIQRCTRPGKERSGFTATRKASPTE
jgi:IS5 family transposase